MLDYGYQLPDWIWDQPTEQQALLDTGDLVELADRHFVRGLLPIMLEDGAEFRYGVWLEVDAATFREIREARTDTVRYPELRFAAKIANAAPPWRARLLGVEVDVGVREPNARPFVVAAREAWLQTIIEQGWTR